MKHHILFFTSLSFSIKEQENLLVNTKDKRTRSLGRVFQHNELAKAANGTTVDNKYYLRPIPQSVHDRYTGVFPQNDGY